MSKKHTARPDGLYYSTDKNYFENYEPITSSQATLAAQEQKLKVSLDTKQRAGKVLTVVSGFVGTAQDLEDLGKKLKVKCGCGGSVKEGLIFVQGDCKQKIIQFLMDWGYAKTKG